MYNKKKVALPLLAVTALLLSGFSWNFGGSRCKEALDLAKKLPGLQDDATRTQEEAKIIELCPDGAAAQYVAGQQAERAGSVDTAISAYRRALQDEPSLALASGSLGVLYLQRGMLDEAAVELTKGVAGAPSPVFHKALGKVMLEKRIYPLALYHLGEAERQTPGDADVMVAMADVYQAQGQLDRAEDEYRRALVAEPSSEPASLGLAQLYLQKNEQDKALDLLKRTAVSNPRSNRIHLLLADLYEKRGDTKQAEYERLLGGRKDTVASIAEPQPMGMVLGDQLAAKGEVDRAAEAYRSVLKTMPGAVPPYERLGSLFFKAGRDGEAITAYREASYRQSDNPEVYYNLGLLQEQRGQLDEAVVSYKRATEKRPEFAEARLKLAEIRLARGNTREAVEEYREFLKLKPESADIHLKLARVLVKEKQLPQAVESYQAVIKLAPNNPDAHRELAGVYRDQEQGDKAIEHYKRALELAKGDVDSRNALVTFYVKGKRYDDLVVLLQEAAELAPDDPNNHYRLGLVYDFRKEYDSAITSYKQAIALKGDYARALYALGRVYMKTGRLVEAREALEAAKQADPNLVETSILLNNIRDDFNPAPRNRSRQRRRVNRRKRQPAKSV
jgi:tetratricopeptide (TPR) repeat protein